MKRTTIALTDELALLIDRERRQRGVSAATVVRDALDDYFSARSDAPSFVGIGRSNEAHIARDSEDILAREWTYERLMGIAEADPTQRSRMPESAEEPQETDRSELN
jgi:Ribbon-helix-helix protein, copG family